MGRTEDAAAKLRDASDAHGDDSKEAQDALKALVAEAAAERDSQ